MEALPDLQQVEIVRLAKDVLPGHYIELCVALGYSINHGHAVLASHQSKYKEATTQVLNDWNTKQTERNQIRSNLARKLKEAELGELGTKLSTGKYLQSEDKLSNQEAVPGDSAMATQGGVTDDLLSKLAEDIETGEQMEALGRSLGFKPAAINRYTETNRLDHVDGRVTCKGTRDMLFDWRQTVEPADQHSRLKQFLIDAHLVMLAETLNLKETITTQDIYSEKISESLTVGKCRTILEDTYSTELCKIRMKPWDQNNYAEFKEMHTVVTMVKKDSRGGDIKEKEILQGSVGEIFSAKVNGRLPSRILISAPAGRGKTTAVAKMAHDWVHKERGSGLEDLPLLFVVKFRNTSQRTSIGEAIISQLLSDVDDLTPEGLESFIREHQGICHIVLDGLDEYAGISSTSNILSILRWKMFRQCRVLVTTRPHLDEFFSQGDLPVVYTKMGIEGFSRESSRDYIDKFFTSIKKPMSGKSADGLKIYLDEQPLIEELVKTPLFCLMACHLWSEDLLQSETTTQTALLDKVNLFLMHHANARSPGLIESPEKLTEIILKLGKVALTGLLNDAKKLVFTSRDFQRIPSILHMACAIGIVSKTDVSLGRLPQTSETSLATIEFYHKLAQEHAAGKFLADETNHFMFALKISKIDRVLRKINRNIGEYENLIRFAAGTKNSLCVRIMETLLTNSYLSESERSRILLDCSSESEANVGNVSSLIRRCVTAQSMILKSPTVYTAVGMRNLPCELKQKVVHVQIEESILATTVTDGLWSCLKSFPELRCLTISDSSLTFPLSPPDLPSVTKLSAVRVTSKSYKGLISSLSCLEDIDITINEAEGDIANITAGLRRTGGQKLTQINLHALPSLPSVNRSVSSETIKELGLLIRQHTKKLQRITLSGVIGLNEEDLVELLESSTSLTSMTHLNLQCLDSWCFNFDKRSGVQITKCHLSSEMTSRMWACLRPFTSLNHLIISDSSLSCLLTPPELPSVTKLLANKLTLQCYQGLISSLPGLRDIDFQDAARDDFVEFVESSSRLTSLQRLEIKTLDEWQFDFDTAKGVQISDCRMSSEMTCRMWACLRSFTSQKYLTILDSSLSFPPSPPELPSVTNLSAERVTSQCYEGLISSLPGLEGIDITMDDAEGDIARYTAVLRRTAGQKLKHIYLYGPLPLSPERSRVSRETMRGLGLFIKEHTQNLQKLHLRSVKCTNEDDLVYLMECCRCVKTMQYVSLEKCGTTENGRLHSHLEHLHRGYSDWLFVGVWHDNGRGLIYFSIPRTDHVD